MGNILPSSIGARYSSEFVFTNGSTIVSTQVALANVTTMANIESVITSKIASGETGDSNITSGSVVSK